MQKSSNFLSSVVGMGMSLTSLHIKSIVSITETFVNGDVTSKETNWNGTETTCVPNRSHKGCNISHSHCDNLWYGEFIIEVIGLEGAPGLCILTLPYNFGIYNPMGLIFLYVSSSMYFILKRYRRC